MGTKLGTPRSKFSPLSVLSLCCPSSYALLNFTEQGPSNPTCNPRFCPAPILLHLSSLEQQLQETVAVLNKKKDTNRALGGLDFVLVKQRSFQVKLTATGCSFSRNLGWLLGKVIYLWDNSSGMFMFKPLTQPQCPLTCQSCPHTLNPPAQGAAVFIKPALSTSSFFPSLSALSRAAWQLTSGLKLWYIKGFNLPKLGEVFKETKSCTRGTSPCWLCRCHHGKREEISCFSNSLGARNTFWSSNLISPSAPHFTRQAKKDLGGFLPFAHVQNALVLAKESNTKSNQM